MTAEEANKVARNYNISQQHAAMKKTLAAIHTAAEMGEYRASVDAFLPDDCIKELRAQGYRVQSETDRNESYTIISWE